MIVYKREVDKCIKLYACVVKVFFGNSVVLLNVFVSNVIKLGELKLFIDELIYLFFE